MKSIGRLFVAHLILLISIIVLPMAEHALAVSSCACPSITLKCSNPMQMAAACPSGTDACATDASAAINPCTVWMKEDDCTRLGLSSTSSPINPALLTMNCAADYIDPTSANPQQDLAIAQNCCILQHELVHTTDSACTTGTISPCNEAPAYAQSNSCTTDVANAFCSNFADDSPALAAACLNVCNTQVWDLELEFASTCMCDEFNSGVTDNNVATNNCRAECLSDLSPDDIAVECQSVIANSLIPESTSSDLNDFCEIVFSSSSSSSESSSESSSSSSTSSEASSSEESSSSMSLSSDSSSSEELSSSMSSSSDSSSSEELSSSMSSSSDSSSSEESSSPMSSSSVSSSSEESSSSMSSSSSMESSSSEESSSFSSDAFTSIASSSESSADLFP